VIEMTVAEDQQINSLLQAGADSPFSHPRIDEDVCFFSSQIEAVTVGESRPVFTGHEIDVFPDFPQCRHTHIMTLSRIHNSAGADPDEGSGVDEGPDDDTRHGGEAPGEIFSSNLQDTNPYASLLRTSGALHRAVLEQPVKKAVHRSRIPAGVTTVKEASWPWDNLRLRQKPSIRRENPLQEHVKNHNQRADRLIFLHQSPPLSRA